MFYISIPVLSCVAYFVLIHLTLRHRPLRKVHKTFLLYIVGVSLWAFLSFIISAKYFPGISGLLSELMLISGVYTVVAYYHFLRSFMNKPGGIGVVLGYTGVLALVPLIVSNRVAYHVTYSPAFGTAPDVEYTSLSIGLVALGAIALVGWAMFQLFQKYRHSTDPLERNRLTYLLAGFILMALFGLTKLSPAITKYPLAHLGNLGNALFITYAIVRYQLLDIRMVFRRGLVYALTGLCFVGLYAAILLGVLQSLHLHASYTTMLAGAGVALLIAFLFYPLRDTVQERVERLIYRESYDYRHMLLTFANKMSHVLNMEELAENMLTLVTKAIHAEEASLYLPDDESGDFVPRFSLPSQGSRISQMVIVKDNPIVTWLAKEGRPLGREQVDIIPQFKGLWDKEREQLAESGVELFFPIKNKDALIGILALGMKQHGSSYRSEDIDLVTTMAAEAGVVMENAQLYAAAKMRANTDELTGLFNHRYFHERLEEEVARGLRFGEIFSLVLMDLDLFKRYNDIHGHLAGDGVLREIGESLKGSLRAVDMAFRYGGDEFAVILPGTSSSDASKVAERIRKEVEQTMDSQGVLLTCSLGIAFWPTDGVMREGLMQCADSALYHAKQWGNRTCLYSDTVAASTRRPGEESASSKEIISTIYALAATVDARDHYTYGHSKKVSNYAVAIAEAVGYSPDRIAIIRTAALLHDIGKIGISDELLSKPGLLTDEDWKPIYAHPILGVSILKHVDGLAPCLPGIQYHHERYDGTGYPSGLAGDNIPLDARIVAVADAYEAMTSPRPYREGTLTPEEALEELERNMGTQFDPELVKVFCALRRQTLTLPKKVKVK